MPINDLISRLSSFPATLDTLLRPLPPEAWRWRPPGGGWSLIEIVNHLIDEEVEDFRARLRGTIESPGTPWAPIEPEKAVLARDYQSRDPEESLARFAEERRVSVEWLQGLVDVDWGQAHADPGFPALRAGDLLASWAVHDARHLAQVARRVGEIAAHEAHPYTTHYAG